MPWYDDLGNACSYKVNLRLNSIATPTVAELNMLKGAQLVYGQYGICISFVSGQSLLLSKKQQGKLETIYGSCEFEKVTSDDQTLLHSLDDNYASSPFDIRVYFVSKIYDPDLKDLHGCAGYATGRPALNVAASGTLWTLAHELGHVLLGKSFRPVHMDDDRTNIMHAPTDEIIAAMPQFNTRQLATIKTSVYCRRYEEKMTPVNWQTKQQERSNDFFQWK